MQKTTDRARRLVLDPSRVAGFGDQRTLDKELGTWPIDAPLDNRERDVIKQAILALLDSSLTLPPPAEVLALRAGHDEGSARSRHLLSLEALHEKVWRAGEVVSTQPAGSAMWVRGASERAQAILNLMEALAAGGRVANCNECRGLFWAGRRPAAVFCSAACRVTHNNAKRVGITPRRRRRRAAPRGCVTPG